MRNKWRDIRCHSHPHVIPGLYPNTKENILAAVEGLNQLLQKHDLPLQVLPGAGTISTDFALKMPSYLAGLACQIKKKTKGGT